MMTSRKRVLPLASIWASIWACICLMAASPVAAQDFYAGFGLSNNSYTAEDSNFDDAIGYQIFGGYDLGSVFGVEQLNLALEATYFDSGEFEQDTDVGTVNIGSASGLALSAVLGFALTDNFSLTARGGYDLGDDDGALLGLGAALRLNERISLGGELVGREHVDSLQVNMSFRF
jgi:hypothetical protein